MYNNLVFPVFFFSDLLDFSPKPRFSTMVVSLGPGKFYDPTLPRPRIYNDVKFNDERVDPPVPVTDPLISWANEAHWSMGGLSFKRLRLMGKIEGNVNKLRAEREKLFKKQNRSVTAMASSDISGSKDKNVIESERPSSISPPPAPVVSKRRRFMALLHEDDGDEDTEEEGSSEEEEVRVQTKNRGVRRRLVKKLGDDFDRVASERTDVSDTANHDEMASPLKGLNSKSESMVLRRRSQKTDDVDVQKEVEEVDTSNAKEKTLKAGKKSKSRVSANGVAKRGSS